MQLMHHNFPAWYTVCLSLFSILRVLYSITTIHKEPLSFHPFPKPKFMSISKFWKRATFPSSSKHIYHCLRLRTGHFLWPAVHPTTRRLSHNAQGSGVSLATRKGLLQNHLRGSPTRNEFFGKYYLLKDMLSFLLWKENHRVYTELVWFTDFFFPFVPNKWNMKVFLGILKVTVLLAFSSSFRILGFLRTHTYLRTLVLIS